MHCLMWVGSDLWCSEICAFDLGNDLVSSREWVRKLAEMRMKEIDEKDTV